MLWLHLHVLTSFNPAYKADCYATATHYYYYYYIHVQCACPCPSSINGRNTRTQLDNIVAGRKRRERRQEEWGTKMYFKVKLMDNYEYAHEMRCTQIEIEIKVE